MKLWLLGRLDNVDYDEYTTFVIRAETEEDARSIAYEQTHYSLNDTFNNPQKTYCMEIDVEGDRGIILESRSSA